MIILVLSDSHSSLRFMRECIAKVKPDQIIHLGDYYEDGAVMEEENGHLPFYQVPGNCDRYRCVPWQKEILITPVCGVRMYMTHGHRHGVKMGIDRLLADAHAANVAAVLYGHTHIPDCHQESDGLWVLNPGSCGSMGGTAGLIYIENGKIISCRILDRTDLEEFA